MFPMPRERRTGVDISNDEASVLFSTYIKLGLCRPKVLFKVDKVDKNHLTSSWADMKQNYEFLSQLSEKTKGRLLKSKKIGLQLDSFLRHNDMVWAMSDVELAISGLRAMVGTLGMLSRCAEKRPPRSYECLMALVAKMSPKEIPDVEDQVCI